MTDRHPFYDPDQAFRSLWNSIPASARMRDYLRGLADDSDGRIERPALRLISSGKSRVGRLAAEDQGQRLLIALDEPVRCLDTDFSLEGLDSPRPTISLMIKAKDERPEHPRKCTLLLIEPDALRALFDEVPDLRPELDDDLRPSLLALFERKNLRRYQASLFATRLPAVEIAMKKGKAAFEISPGGGPTPNDPVLSREILERLHLVAVLDDRPLTRE